MRARILSAIILLLTTLSQNNLPYHANTEIPSNDMLFYGNSSYKEEILSLSKLVLEKLITAVQQEPSQAARGNMALEACNCIVSSFMLSKEILSICHSLIETAKSCLSPKNKYLQSTIQFVDKQLPVSARTL